MARLRNYVVLVDESDRPLGVAEKLAAHQGQGMLHRAISVFIFTEGRMLLQRRALEKYHFPGLWANACCSHPQEDESPIDAAHARLREELGFDTELLAAGHLLYHDRDAVSGLVEHEFDHLFAGRYDGPVRPDLGEVCALEWARPGELVKDVSDHPERYAPWLKRALGAVLERSRALGLIA